MRVLSLLSCLVVSNVAFAEAYTVLPEESFFGVVTWKDGVAAKLAHNHLVVAKGVEAKLDFSPSKVVDSTFEASIPVEKLVVDAPAAQVKWQPILEELGVVAPLIDMTDKERVAVRESMLSRDQLSVAKYPVIKASLKGLEAKETRVGSRIFSHEGTVELTIRNMTVSKKVLVALKAKDGELEAEALGRFEFTQFGIEPYSAFLGAVKVKNEFALYVKVKAKK